MSSDKNTIDDAVLAFLLIHQDQEGRAWEIMPWDALGVFNSPPCKSK